MLCLIKMTVTFLHFVKKRVQFASDIKTKFQYH